MTLKIMQTDVGAWIWEVELSIGLRRHWLVAQLLVECLHNIIHKMSIHAGATAMRSAAVTKSDLACKD